MLRSCLLSVSLLAVLTLSWIGSAFAQEKQSDLDPAFAAWYYPKSDSPGSATMEGRLHQTLLTTADDVNTIENFYRRQAGNPSGERKADAEPPPFGIHTSLGYPHAKDKSKYVRAIWGDDSETKTDGAPRGVTIRTLVYDTDAELVTVTISRAKGEKTSHILLLCLKKK